MLASIRSVTTCHFLQELPVSVVITDSRRGSSPGLWTLDWTDYSVCVALTLSVCYRSITFQLSEHLSLSLLSSTLPVCLSCSSDPGSDDSRWDAEVGQTQRTVGFPSGVSGLRCHGCIFFSSSPRQPSRHGFQVPAEPPGAGGQ